MKNLIFIVLLLTTASSLVKAQNNSIDKIQGKWAGSITSQSNSMSYYHVIKGNAELNLSFDSGKLVHISEMKVGFINNRKDTLSENDFEHNGKYFFVGKEYNNKIVGKIIENFDLQSLTYYYGNTDVYEFYKVDTLPIFVYKEILEWDRLHNTFFAAKFIVVAEKQIAVSKSFLYTNSSIKSRSYLIKGDKIIIVEDVGDWYKAFYKSNKVIGGWIKKSDTF